MFRKLSAALQIVQEADVVMAEDVSETGQKIFRVATLQQMVATYASLKTRHWYECLLENRPSRIFLDIESYEEVNLQQILDALTTVIQHTYAINPEIRILDSSSEKKNSWHLVCTNVYLKNVYHVGAFVRRLALGTGNTAIDTAVYTKNRMFRICGSSKFGSERVLKNDRPWYELLVQTVNVPTFECLELDGSEPVSCCISPDQLFTFDGVGWQKKTTSRLESSSTQCSLLDPVLNYLDSLCGGNLYRHKTSMTLEGTLVVPSKSKQCSIAGRCHKGNNIWFKIDCVNQKVFQHCYDEDCRGKSHLLETPERIWSLWNEQWQSLSLTPKNEKTLYNVVY